MPTDTAPSVALYSAVGEALTHFEVDVDAATLTRRGTVTLPANVQYAWPHPTGPWLYVATSNRGSSATADVNHVSALRIDSSGALALHGEPRVHDRRAVHICVEPSGRYLLSAHNLPQSGLTVNAIESDGTLGDEIAQPDTLDFGIYPHQVRVTADGKTTIVVDRGNSAANGKPEDPGALRLYRLRDGVHETLQVVAPGGGYGFGPRHVDFHPTKPWVYVSDERTSRLYMFRMKGGRLDSEAAFARDTLADREHLKPRQLAGTIHVHPNGRFVYVANRADHTVESGGAKVFGGGENSIAVYAIDQETGEPTLVQHAGTHALHVRTFSFDPSGRLMVAASIKPLEVREADGVETVPATLAVFRVAEDGTLAFARKYDVETSGKIQYWSGLVAVTP